MTWAKCYRERVKNRNLFLLWARNWAPLSPHLETITLNSLCWNATEDMREDGGCRAESQGPLQTAASARRTSNFQKRWASVWGAEEGSRSWRERWWESETQVGFYWSKNWNDWINAQDNTKNGLLGIAHLKRRVNYFIQKKSFKYRQNSSKMNGVFSPCSLWKVTVAVIPVSNYQAPSAQQSRINSISISGICLTFN